MEPDLGRHHPAVRRVRALRRDPRQRRREGVFVAEGRHLAEEALRSGIEIESCLYAEPFTEEAAGRNLLDGLHRAGVPAHRVSATVMEGLQDARSPQPVLIVARRVEAGWPDVLSNLERGFLAVVAVGVQDPGNLGTLLRTAEAAGASLFCAATPSADLFHPRTVRATMGSVFRLRAVQAPLPRLLEPLRNAGVRVAATVAREGKGYREAAFERPLALLFGGEGAGLDPEIAAGADERIHVPMRGGVESLSVGAAAAIVLFEAAARWDASGGSPSVAAGVADDP